MGAARRVAGCHSSLKVQAVAVISFAVDVLAGLVGSAITLLIGLALYRYRDASRVVVRYAHPPTQDYDMTGGRPMLLQVSNSSAHRITGLRYGFRVIEQDGNEYRHSHVFMNDRKRPVDYVDPGDQVSAKEGGRRRDLQLWVSWSDGRRRWVRDYAPDYQGVTKGLLFSISLRAWSRNGDQPWRSPTFTQTR